MRVMSDSGSIACMEMDINALRLLHRVISEAHDGWPGGPAEEQDCLLRMKTQLFAALMDHMLESDPI